MTVFALDKARNSIALNPGEIDDNARYVFMNGQCHALALALHRVYGWELMAAGPFTHLPYHWLARNDDVLFDIKGAYTERTAVERWTHVWEATENDLWRLVEDGYYRYPNLLAADTFLTKVAAYTLI